ncbi:MAG: ATP-binding protein [Polyangiales bacterium]
MTTAPLPLRRSAYERTARGLFNEHLASVYQRRDRVFAVLMAAQWAFGLLVALTLSPHAWAGRAHSTHLHVYYAVFVGGALSGTAALLCLLRPGWVVTRHAVAVAQMLWSALLIHLTGGRIETHFHVFGSLAFLAFYRDWKVLATATAVVTVDHLLRGLAWPESVYGLTTPEWWRTAEHACWVLFENVVLVLGIQENRREMKALAARQVDLEVLNASVEAQVESRTRELAASREQYRALVENTRSIPWQWRIAEARFVYVGPQAASLLGCPTEAWLRPGFIDDRMHPDDLPAVTARWKAELAAGRAVEVEYRLRTDAGAWVTVRSVANHDRSDGCLRGFIFDVTEQRRLEFELHQAQKLESVGRLASGIAHEINTPIQFVNDSVHFVRDAFQDALVLLTRYRALRAAANDGPVPREALEGVDQAEDDADLPYLLENVPKALDRSVDGLARVATLVRSMKEFAHADRGEEAPADLNHALSTTLTIARNEYKYVADVETDFGDLPPVLCRVDELNQAFLNLLVNAAHAIGDVVQGTDRRGRIRVATRPDGDHVVVSIADTGGGIPEHVRGKIFEPFFTTKEVGRGTGQGLPITRSVVVDRHRGALTFTSEVGVGTTFYVRLPVAGPGAAGVAA